MTTTMHHHPTQSPGKKTQFSGRQRDARCSFPSSRGRRRAGRRRSDDCARAIFCATLASSSSPDDDVNDDDVEKKKKKKKKSETTTTTTTTTMRLMSRPIPKTQTTHGPLLQMNRKRLETELLAFRRRDAKGAVSYTKAKATLIRCQTCIKLPISRKKWQIGRQA